MSNGRVKPNTQFGRNVYSVEVSTSGMSTSVKMDEETKSRLEELQARIKIETGEKVTQQELLHAIVEHALSTEHEVLDEFRETTVPASQEEIEEFHGGISSSGEETTEEDVDEVLYG